MFKRKPKPPPKPAAAPPPAPPRLQQQTSMSRVPPPTPQRKLTVSECLMQAQGALRRLRGLNPGDMQAFPLLNEVQRLRKLTGCVCVCKRTEAFASAVVQGNPWGDCPEPNMCVLCTECPHTHCRHPLARRPPATRAVQQLRDATATMPPADKEAWHL